MKGNRNALETLGLSLFTILASFLILERWTITSLGPLSFNRVWQLYINYPDFGFVRRGLMGTILHATHLADLFANEYFFAIFIQHVAIVVLVSLVATYLLRSPGQDRGLLFKSVVLLSPTFVLQVAYATGTLDAFVLIVVVANILFVRNVFLFSALIVVGILIHELFVFAIPAQLLALYLRRESEVAGSLPKILKLLAAPLAASLATLFVVMMYGKTDWPKAEYEAAMERMIPYAAHKMVLWSGYFEVSSTVSDNSRTIGFLARKLWDYAAYICIPVAYLVTLIAVLSTVEKRLVHKLLLVGVTALPMVAYLVATDFYRWIGLSANLALMLLLFYTSKNGAKVARGWLAVLLAFSVLAPFGAAVIDNPFPAHKFILNRILP